jgi:hypothetical protein
LTFDGSKKEVSVVFFIVFCSTIVMRLSSLALAALLLVELSSAFVVAPSQNGRNVALFESSEAKAENKPTTAADEEEAAMLLEDHVLEDMQQMLLTLEKRVTDGPGDVSLLEVEDLQARSNRVLVDLKAKETDRLNGVGSAPPPAAKPISVTLATTPITDLQSELDAKGLGDCHGILHASGVRRLIDLQTITDSQITDMKADDRARSKILKVKHDLEEKNTNDSELNTISTVVDGAFDRPVPGRFDAPWSQDFDIQVVSAEHDIFRARLFTVEQCEQINRMAEYHAYPHRNRAQFGHGWTNKLYTLTAQHLLCKDIPGFLSTTDHIFKQLLRALYDMFPDRIKPGTICWESPGEPHLVKYNGESKGTEMHIDNSEFVYLTINAVLSADDEFTGGGTYIKAIDQTIHLKQGEMIIHLGDLEHAGADITSGVRRLLIAFLACEWVDEELNIEKLHEARDYVPPVV